MRWWQEPATRDFWQGLICGLLIGGGAVSGYWLLIAHKVVPL